MIIAHKNCNRKEPQSGGLLSLIWVFFRGEAEIHEKKLGHGIDIFPIYRNSRKRQEGREAALFHAATAAR